MATRSGYTVIEGLFVEVKHGNFEKALRIFTRKVNDSGILQEVKDRQHFVKPSMAKKLKRKNAVKRERYRVLEGTVNNFDAE